MSVQAMSWVISESRHKGSSLLVLLMIANHAHADGSGAFPSTATIARECRMSERQIRRIIDTVLEPSRELNVVRETGRPHQYDLPAVRGATPDNLSDLPPDEMSDPPRTSEAPTPDMLALDLGHSYVRRTKGNQKQPSSNHQRLATQEDFDAFWKHYPRKEDKIDARKSWDKRVKAGTEPQALIDGAERYAAWTVAALQTGELEAKCYIKLPATWLNKGSESNVLHEPGRAPAAMSKHERARIERRRWDGTMGSGAGSGNGVRRVGLGDAPGDVRTVARGDRESG